MRRLVLIISALALAGPMPALATSPAFHFTMEITGDVLPCPDNVYTVASGTIETVLHEGEATSGNTNFTVTTTPRQVALEDADGNAYSMTGAIWFGGASNAKTGAEVITATHNLQIVKPGVGVVDTIKLVERFRNGELITFDFGSCTLA
jgi:hypothetical protein